MADSKSENIENKTETLPNKPDTGGDSNFIFGQNMAARATVKPSSSPPEPEKKATKSNADSSDENGHQPTVAFISRSPFSSTTHTTLNSCPKPYAGGGALAPSKLVPNPFAKKTSATSSPCASDDDEKSNPRPIIAPASLKFKKSESGKPDSGSACFRLKPSAFGTSVQSAPEKKPLLKPATLKADSAGNKSGEGDGKETEEKADNTDTDAAVSGEDDTKKTADSTETSASLNSSGSYFTQFMKNPDSSLSDSGNSVTSGYLFGQNLEDRVTNIPENLTKNAESETNGDSSASGFVFGENLSVRVSNAAASKADENEKSTEEKAEASGTTSPSSKTLAESASEYQAKHSQIQEYEEVQVVTGEENESNVLQMNGKVFVFEAATTNWLERGRGILRLNDMSSDINKLQSRVVMRTSGSLRVILNSKIWSGMTIQKASEKSVRLTAMDEGGVKIFLIMSSSKDTDQLFGAIDWRIQQLKMSEEVKSMPDTESSAEKRTREESPEESPPRKARRSTDRRDIHDESNDSSVLDPETEASNESFGSSSGVKSTSSD